MRYGWQAGRRGGASKFVCLSASVSLDDQIWWPLSQALTSAARVGVGVSADVAASTAAETAT